MERKTALYDLHLACGGKMVPFAGYLLPVQYATGIIAEHMAVRHKCGLFDVSHMGEVLCQGPAALENLNHLLTNDFTSLGDGRVRYSPMCNGQGGVVDDLLVYRVKEGCYLLVVNAANKDKDFQWMQTHQLPGAQFTDLSDTVSQLALQGPLAGEILAKLASPADIPGKYYSFVPRGTVAGVPCLISKTGYTGEDGYELYCAWEDGPRLWEALMEAGRDLGLTPCGLGARDTLRLEAAMPLYGHEMDDTITPLQAGLDFAVKLQKPEFIGRQALVDQGQPATVRVGLRVTGRGIIREHAAVYAGGRQIGHTTSGTHCPAVGPVAMALVERAYAQPGQEVEAEVRGRRVAAQVVPLPFYKREN